MRVGIAAWGRISMGGGRIGGGRLRRAGGGGAYGRAMGITTSKVAARKAARRAQAAAQAAAAQRLKLNVEDLATFFAEQGRAEAVDEWLLAQQGKLRRAADARRLAHRRTAGAALRQIRDRGESVKSIATLAGVSESLVRALMREAGRADGDGGACVNGAAVGVGVVDAGGDGRSWFGAAAGEAASEAG